MKVWLLIIYVFLLFVGGLNAHEYDKKQIAYIVSDKEIPFWGIMAKGIMTEAQKSGYDLQVYTSQNSLEKELRNSVKVMQEKVDGIVISPINSSSCTTVVKLAKKANIPVVIADVGCDGGEYLSYISSNNFEGAYKIGKVLVKKMKQLGWEKGSVGIVAIPQNRSNGQARTKGFLKALDEAHIKSADLKQQKDFSYNETYRYVGEMIKENKDLRAIWLQGSDKYQAALDAIKKKKKEKDILLISFDAEPIFLDLIVKEVLVGAAMQQPFLMGRKSVMALGNYFDNKDVEKNIELPVLAVSKENMAQKLEMIKVNVLGLVGDVQKK